MTGRNSTIIESSYVILRGLFSKGVSTYGPFNTYMEAKEYGGKNFPDDTIEIVLMYKETITHGDNT
tara:strand:- start:119 stop:316 length:198 start_codon:yes stop_codon:yes gene_type:complete